MKWSPQQDDALRAVDRWLKTGEQPFFVLDGFAGTGKTTLAKHLAEDAGRVKFVAPTGKAAQVLSSKGCPASTVHQLIYTPKNKSKARLVELQEALSETIHELHSEPEMQTATPDERDKMINESRTVIELRKKIREEEDNMKRAMFVLNLESEAKDVDLIVCDERSMIDTQIGTDMLSFGTKVLFLGDPAQLPPVGGASFLMDRESDVMLTEVHRQAKESPIIHMATETRLKRDLPVGMYGECQVHAEKTPMSEIAQAADQILCGKNATRKAANNRMREFLGRSSPIPQTGDRLVCLRNNHNLGLLNGQIWIAAEDAMDLDETYTLTAYNEDKEGDVQTLQVWKDEPNWYDRKEAEEFDFGYCLTTHKAQGSQWDSVMVMDESWVFRRDRHRWLYTAITRAAEQLDIVKM